MKKAMQLIESSKSVLISGHLRADGDCLGAGIVMYYLCQALGKQVEIILPDNPDSRYGFLEEKTPWKVWQGELPTHDLFLICDCNELSRLGAMGAVIAESEVPRLVLDHHPLPTDSGIWTAKIHDESAAASGLLAFEFAKAMGVTLPEAAMEAAFVAIMTDTGWLKYSNADSRAWNVAAELVAGGVVADSVFQNIYQQVEAGRPKGIASVLAHTQYFEDGRFALAWATDKDLQTVQGELVDTDEILDILRSVKTVELVALLTERQGQAKLSLRSKSLIDVNQIARGLGGGGHVRAAGATLTDTEFDQALNRVREACVLAVQQAAIKA